MTSCTDEFSRHIVPISTCRPDLRLSKTTVSKRGNIGVPPKASNTSDQKVLCTSLPRPDSRSERNGSMVISRTSEAYSWNRRRPGFPLIFTVSASHSSYPEGEHLIISVPIELTQRQGSQGCGPGVFLATPRTQSKDFNGRSLGRVLHNAEREGLVKSFRTIASRANVRRTDFTSVRSSSGE